MRVHIPEAYDVRKMRARMKLNQKEFAKRFGFSLDSIHRGARAPGGQLKFVATIFWYGKAWISWTGSHGIPDGAQSGEGRPSGSRLVEHGE
jgi:hypothetical protein